MTWFDYPIIALLTITLWAAGIILLYLPSKAKTKNTLGNVLLVGGTLIFALFIVLFWIELDRPPLRTLGETRLWYSFFILLLGLIIWFRWKYKWFLIFAIVYSFIFMLFNYLKPEIHDKTLMPALQSPWFVPHVIVYMLSYSLLGVSSLVGLIGLYHLYFREYRENLLKLGDNLVYVGFSLLTFGMIFGALWAKIAWGHYWTWDPKETWAFLTWFGYLLYMHFRFYKPNRVKAPLWILFLAFIIMMICWFGINYLPSAQNSVHVYSS